jgi:hypothetical protein
MRNGRYYANTTVLLRLRAGAGHVDPVQPSGDVVDDHCIDVLGGFVLGGAGRAAAGCEEVVVIG